MFLRAVVCGSALALGLVPLTSQASPVGPGGSTALAWPADLPSNPLPGTEIASKDLDFSIHLFPIFQAGSGAPDEHFVPDDETDIAGTLHLSVRREASNHLTFVYNVEYPLHNAQEKSEFVFGDFGGFSTDVAGRFGEESINAGFITRSDGKITALTQAGAGGPPMLVVQTNATAFDENGFATYTAADDKVGHDPNNPDALHELIAFGGTAQFTGLYQPTEDGGGAVAVPLPAAALASIPVFAGMIALRSRRMRFS